MDPQLYNKSGQRLAILDNIIKDTAIIKRVVNGEFTFSFEAYEKALKSEYFLEENTLLVDGQVFDIKYVEQKHSSDIRYSMQCEHVSYRMEDGEDNQYASYVYIGTPREILTDILSGTEFMVGVVDFTEEMAVTVNNKITRKKLIAELVNLLGGEIGYSTLGFTIDIRDTIGQDNGFQARFGKNLKRIKKTIDRRGELKTQYQIDLVRLKNSNEYIQKGLQGLETLGVGDSIRIIDELLNLDIVNRVVSIEYNPIFEINTKLEIASTLATLATEISNIYDSSVSKEELYNGVKVGPKDGFVALRSDGRVKTILNATEGISIYSDIGEGLKRNFFVDSEGKIQGKELVIDGKSTFGGKVDITNGATSIIMAPDTDNPFTIKNGANEIFKVTAAGLGTFYGGGRFFGEVDVVNQNIQVKIAPSGATAFLISNSGFEIFKVTPTGVSIVGNLTMTGGSIDWANVSGSIPDANLISGTNWNAKTTKIGPDGIYTGALSALQVNAVAINASSITTGTLSANRISTIGLSAEKIYKPGNPANYLTVGGSYADLILYKGTSKSIEFYDDGTGSMMLLLNESGVLLKGANNKTTPLGAWDFTNTIVTGFNVKFA